MLGSAFQMAFSISGRRAFSGELVEQTELDQNNWAGNAAV
jgi:hypothetical protein